MVRGEIPSLAPRCLLAVFYDCQLVWALAVFWLRRSLGLQGAFPKAAALSADWMLLIPWIKDLLSRSSVLFSGSRDAARQADFKCVLSTAAVFRATAHWEVWCNVWPRGRSGSDPDSKFDNLGSNVLFVSRPSWLVNNGVRRLYICAASAIGWRT